MPIHVESRVSLSALLCATVSTFAVATLLPGWAVAQSSGSKGAEAIEEILVTSRKFEERLQDAPLSVTALTRASMEDASFTDLSDIADATPNLNFTMGGSTSGSGSNAVVFIRGIGQVDWIITTDPGIGIYIDGVYYPRAVGGVMDLLDVERIEVLRGPQGTLFGKNTIGGAINIISSAPGDEFSARGQVTIGRFNRIDLDASVEAPLVTDKLSAKVAVSSRNRDGFVKRLADGGRDNDEDRQTIRAGLRWTPTEDWDIRLNADYTREREASVGYVVKGVVIDPDAGVGTLTALWNMLVGMPQGTIYDENVMTNDPYAHGGDALSVNDFDIWGVSLTVERDLGADLTLKSITAYRGYDAVFGTDLDGSTLPFGVNRNEDEQWQISQEIQFIGRSFDDRLKWVAGVFGFKEKPKDSLNFRALDGMFQALEGLPDALIPLAAGVACPAPFPAPCAGGAGNPYNMALDINMNTDIALSVESFAVFGQGTYSLTDRFSATFGLRYNYEKKKFNIHQVHTNSGMTTLAGSMNNDWSSWTPRFGLEYKVTDDAMVYVSASRGFKSGGYNGRPTSNAEIQSFDEEFIWAYEAGLKSEWFDRRLRLNLAGFYYDYTDIQLSSAQFTPETGLIAVVENAGDAEIWGFEGELTARPAAGLDVGLGVGYTHGEYKKLNPATNIDPNAKLPRTPSWTVNAMLQYEHSLGDNAGSLTFRGDMRYQSKIYNDPLNIEIVSQKGYATANARVTYTDPSERFDLSVFVTNLTNKNALDNGFFSPVIGVAQAVYIPPRQWGVTLRYSM